LGVALSSPCIGWIAGRLANRQVLIVTNALITAIIMSAIVFIPNLSTPLLFILFFSLGLFCTSYVINYAYSQEWASENSTSLSIGFTNTMAIVFAPIVQPIIGWILSIQSHGAIQYSAHDFRLALSIMPICIILAFIISLGMKDPQCQSK